MISFICLLLAYSAVAVPTTVDVDALQSALGRLGIPNLHCVIQCVQPVGVESDDDDVQARGIIANYAVLADCMKKCSN